MAKHPIEDFVSQPTFADFKIPQLPNLSDAIRTKGFMPGLTKHAEEWQKWRSDFERALVERLRALTPPTMEAEQAAINPVVANVNSATARITVLAAQVTALIDQLTAHIAATVVHGTTSNVVGLTDEQALTRKTIGMGSGNSRKATFVHALTHNTVLSGEEWEIPLDRNAVIAGVLTVEGTLTVDGYLTIV